MQLTLEPGQARSNDQACLRSPGAGTEHDVIHMLTSRLQLAHQLDHRNYISSCSDAVRAANANHVRPAALGQELPRNLTELRLSLGTVDPMLLRSEQFIQQQVALQDGWFVTIQKQFAFEAGFRGRCCCLAAMI